MRHHQRIAMGALAAGLALSPSMVSAGGAGPITHQTTVEYGLTGMAESFRVPTGVRSITVQACGAEGGEGANGGGFNAEFAPGGRGASVESTLGVSEGEKLSIRVGGQGGRTGGYNGGGTSLFDPFFLSEGQGGGGASDVRQGGNSLADRVVIAGGGGGGGGGIAGLAPIPPAELLGGDGGLVGGDAADTAGGRGGSQTQGGAPGVGSFGPGDPGALGRGGDAASGTGGGGGGLYGGGGGSVPLGYGGGGGGGSSLADRVDDGACEGDGSVTLAFEQPLAVTPRAASIIEGDSGSQTLLVPVSLSASVGAPVTAEWATVDGLSAPGLATSGSDFVSAAGTVEFAPGQTRATIAIEILGDTVDEPALLWGEWGIVQFGAISSNAVLETGPFFGAALFVIEDDD